MTSAGAATPLPDGLSELFAVVVRSDSPGDLVRWVRGGDSWEAESPWGGGFATQGPERTVDVMGTGYRLRQKSPDPAALGDAAALVEELRRQRMCQHCSLGDPAVHAVAPDVWGEVKLLCLFRPDPATVESSGGNGARKHWGHPNGCAAVASQDVHASDDWSSYGTYRYGTPMTTYKALESTWCSRCSNAAHITLARVKGELQGQGGAEPSAWDLHVAMIEDRRLIEERWRNLR